MDMLQIYDCLERYLNSSRYIDFDNPDVLKKAKSLLEQSGNEMDLVEQTYCFVRDEIQHSWDAQDPRVTISASDVLREKVGICWAKANLLAALLRDNGIPTGICYQRLTLVDTPDTGYCIHALNVVHLESLDKWIRLDARGNKEGVCAEFSIDHEKLAFDVREEYDEIDYKIVYADPQPPTMEILETSTNALNMYLHELPEKI